MFLQFVNMNVTQNIVSCSRLNVSKRVVTKIWISSASMVTAGAFQKMKGSGYQSINLCTTGTYLLYLELLS